MKVFTVRKTKKLEKILKNLDDIDTTLEEIAVDLKGKMIEKMDKGLNAKTGKAYKALSPVTEAYRKRKNPEANIIKPLVDTGALQRSIEAEVKGNSVIVSSDLEYAKTHQYGRKIPIKPKENDGETKKTKKEKGKKKKSKKSRKKFIVVPARPFIGVTKKEKKDCVKKLKDAIFKSK